MRAALPIVSCEHSHLIHDLIALLTWLLHRARLLVFEVSLE